MFASQLGKYKTIVVSIALFLILDASVLILNFYISFEIADDAVGVNLAGRQRMLSQRMVKSLYDMEISNAADIEVARDELKNTVNLFDSTLTAFDIGGTVRGADGGAVALTAVESQAGRKAIIEAKRIWQPYKQKLSAVIEGSTNPGTEGSASLVQFAKANNLNLLKLMNDLTVDLEQVATSKATRLRLIQTVGITLAIINFLIILFHFLRQLKANDEALEKARGETVEILETVNDGLFLINSDLSIASEHSKALEDLFARKDIAGLSFESLLADVVKPKDLDNTKRFIALLFKPEIKSKLISDLNPLKEIEVTIADEEGYMESKYFCFEFQRAYEGDDIKDILVTVSDISQRVLLAKELETTKEQNQQQLEVLTGVLHTNPAVLSSFVSDSLAAFEKINRLLRQPAKTDSSLRDKLDDMFFEIHKVKGEASALSLENYVQLAHEFEEEMASIRDKKAIAGDDFLPLVVRLERLIKHSESVSKLSEKLSEFSAVSPQDQANKGIAGVNITDWAHLHVLTTNVSERVNKQVELVANGLAEVPLDESFKSLINDLAIQGIRNAISHGIESPETRLAQSKKEQGRIDLRLSRLGDGSLEFIIQDDGDGINIDKVREKAIQSGNWSEQELEGWGSTQLISLIFEPGFSTDKNHLVDSGSGVGMGLIKKRVADFRGKIRVSTRKGRGTRLTVSLPAPLGNSLAA